MPISAAQKLDTLRYVDNRSDATEACPIKPNGSKQGITGLTTFKGASPL